MKSIYEDGKYLDLTKTWHAEDSHWKAEQIFKIISRNQLHPYSIAEVGCGAGGILQSLHEMDYLKEVEFSGYDISPQAIELAKSKSTTNISFFNKDLLQEDQIHFDLLLVIDVFEHVEDYIGFLKKCRTIAEYKVFHIPLDIHVSSVIRNSFIKGRYSIGHLHYFTAESALATLKDTEYEIVDTFFTNHSFGLFRQHPSIKKAVANIPRWLFSKMSVALSARLFGGYSLLVLAR